MGEPARPLGTDDADDLRLYLEAAAREPLLTKEEEIELAQTIEKGKEAEERLAAGRVRSDTTIRRLPVHIHDRLRKLNRSRFQFAQTKGREPTREELAKILDTTVEEVDDLTEMGRREPLSLQSPVGEETELGDLIEEQDSEGQFNEVEDALLREEIGEAVEELLDDRERQVVALRYGLDSGQPLSLRETGK